MYLICNSQLSEVENQFILMVNIGSMQRNEGVLYVLYLTIHLFVYVRLRIMVVRMIGWEVLKTPTQNAFAIDKREV
jgi:hypothetical protein